MIVPDLNNLAYTFELLPKFEIVSNSFLFIQVSMLYTTSSGKRIIRILNNRTQLTENLKELMESINCDVLFNFYIKQAIFVIIKRNLLLAGQKYFEFRCIELFKICMESFKILPENLSSLIIKTLGLMKHPLFVHNNLHCKDN